MNLFLHSYLFAFLFWIDLPVGALTLLMVHRLTGGAWGASVRRILEAAGETIVIFIVLAIPILLWPGAIYPWVAHGLARQHAYLNPAAFRARTIIYLLFWSALSPLLKKGGQATSAIGIIAIAFTTTFAAIDWQMSVEPEWYSTIYGIVYGVGQSLQAFAFVLVVLGVVTKKRAFSEKTLLDVGNILLTLTILWAYVSFMQYLIIWSGNLPHEATWFARRTVGIWLWLIAAIALFQFFAPFGILLFRESKRTPARLAYLGALVALIRIVDHAWMLLPGFDQPLPALAAGAWLGVGALWFAMFLWRLSRRPLFAEDDPDWSLAVREAYSSG